MNQLTHLTQLKEHQSAYCTTEDFPLKTVRDIKARCRISEEIKMSLPLNNLI